MSLDPQRAAALVAAAAAIAVVVVGLTLGAAVVGGADSYGYVSQAHLWATGRLRGELPLVREMVPAVTAEALVPLGYNLGSDRESIVPIYAPGLPMVMAVFERLAGRRAVFWVVPLLGGLAVWSAYLLGRCGAGPLAGALAAILFAASPVFLLQLTAAPMSEVPATAWWALALALLFSDRPSSAAGSGLATGLAILTRPNLVPLAVVLGSVLLRRAVSSAPDRRRLLLFSIPVVASCLIVAALNHHFYGSPLASGYEASALFALEHAAPNLTRYPLVLSIMQTPAIWLAAIAPWLAWRRREGDWGAVAGPRAVTLIEAAFVLAVFACYLFYPAFDAYYTLRFLLPALPALFALLAFTLTPSRPDPPRWRVLAAVAVTIVIAGHSLEHAWSSYAFDTRGERKYAIVGMHIARRLPERAVLLAMQHSGSIRYYAERPIVRYDLIQRGHLDRVLKRLRRLGYRPYFVLEEWEVPAFRERFERRSSFGALDWPPLARLEHAKVAIWDPADRPRQGAGERTTEILPWPFLVR